MTDRLMRLDEVSTRTTLGRSTIYKYIKLNKFPRQKGGVGAVALWRESDIQEWIETDNWRSEQTQ